MAMGVYVDGFVVPVPKKNVEAYPSPFDGKRMFWGGFKELVSL
jgi:uncharacterized protein YbaA (DUF1428 family)